MSEQGNGLLGPDSEPSRLRLKNKLERIEPWRNPFLYNFLVRAKVDNQAGLPPGSLHHVAGANWMAQMVELVNPETQLPPVYAANFSDVDVVGRELVKV